MNVLFAQLKIGKWKISFAVLLWFMLAASGAILKISRGQIKINNFIIFRSVFWHTLHQANLYTAYPAEYFDTNLYGPFFSIIIAPFALLPVSLGCFLWCMCNAALLFYAVKRLPVSNQNKNIILLIGLVEMLTSIQNTQFNPCITAFIILAFIMVENEKDIWATLFIAIGFFVKVYGITSVCFFIFSKHKIKFLLSFIFWFALFFFLPMLLSSYTFIIQSYNDWYNALIVKNANNEIQSGGTDLSFMGLLRRIFSVRDLSNFIVLIPAALLYALSALRFSQYKYLDFKLFFLAFVLIGTVIFSTSAESATFIIAMIGVGIWFVLQPKNIYTISLLVFALVLTSLSATDLFPRLVKTHLIFPYSLKALPCVLIWLTILVQLLCKNFGKMRTAAV